MGSHLHFDFRETTESAEPKESRSQILYLLLTHTQHNPEVS